MDLRTTSYDNGQSPSVGSGMAEDTLDESVKSFLVHLQRLPLQAWIDAAVTDPHGERPIPLAALADAPLADAPELADVDSEASRAADEEDTGDPDLVARRRLREVLEPQSHAVARVRRRIDGMAGVADGFAHPMVTLRMTRVARTAALALLARGQLSDEEFRRLYRPFAAIIPPEQLAS